MADRPVASPSESSVDLYWLPLGAGGRSVRLNGRVFEAVVARLEKRRTCDLYHSALQVTVPEGRYVIEMAPVRDGNGAARGVTAEGPVGGRWARTLRIFRYEIRRWRDGVIPDVNEAVESPRRLTGDPLLAQRVLDLVVDVPIPVWGRDELHAGEMWNSNSVVAGLITRCGLLGENATLPRNGRAPGWDAGVTVALRAADDTSSEESSPARAHEQPEVRGPKRFRVVSRNEDGRRHRWGSTSRDAH